MKKTLLFSTLLISGLAGAQLNQANEPAIGATQSMYLCDSNATNYSAVTGSGVTWDYSDIMGYYGQDKTVSITDATTNPDYSSFPGSAKAYEIGSTVTTFFNSDANHRYSQGFKFYEPSVGDVYATFEADSLTMVTYPFALGSSLTDSYSGTMDFTFNSIPVTEALNGNAYAWIDGEGTLLAPLGVTVNNVLRYKSIDTSTTILPIIGAVEIIREQYEYYDLANQSLPVFIHSSITMQQPSAAPLAEVSMVLSLYTPEVWAGIQEEAAVSFNIYPNPANDKIKVQGEFGEDATASILDQTGRTLTQVALSNLTTIDLSGVDAGVYYLTVDSNGATTTKQFVKR